MRVIFKRLQSVAEALYLTAVLVWVFILLCLLWITDKNIYNK